ncbi:MAG: TIGR04282 family arsenosugar biosynthesis glycosyltransferase [Myxococcota bacterium]|nr:TIGR04282 family arsenosugar biosynthesis glycosyltransferase [Myxococcota bacterium]
MSAGREAGPAVLVVFAKDPQPSKVKTRMTPALSPEGAAAFYREMLGDVLDESARACEAQGVKAVLTVSPASACQAFACFAPPSFRIVAQCEGDLGRRMAYEVARALAQGASKVVLRGSDNPALGADEIARLFDALERCDLVASPDPDGGYGAIGLRVPAADAFDHEMSHGGVLPATLSRAKRAGLSVETTEGSFDLDTPGDLARLAEVRAALPKERCPRTLAYADTHALWDLARRGAS